MYFSPAFFFLCVCVGFGACEAKKTSETAHKNTLFQKKRKVETTQNTDSLGKKYHIITTPKPFPYLVAKKMVQNQFKNFKKDKSNYLKNKKLNPQKVGVFFEKMLVSQILPYWYDTGWDFKGNTLTPQHGKIACGYLVSTTLRDVGVSLQRITLAQQSPDDEALTLACGYDILTIYNPHYHFADIMGQMHQKLKDGIYFVALPKTHVVFLLKKNNQLFFIHSGKTAGKMCLELVEDCPFLRKFEMFRIVPLSENPLFLEKWVKNKLILTYRGF